MDFVYYEIDEFVELMLILVFIEIVMEFGDYNFLKCNKNFINVMEIDDLNVEISRLYVLLSICLDIYKVDYF